MRYSPSFARSSGLIPVLVVLAVLALVPLLSSSMYLRHLLVLAFVFGIVASTTRQTVSTPDTASTAVSLSRSPIVVRGLWMPGVSTKTIWASGRATRAAIE